MKKLIFSILLSILGLSVNSQARLALMTNFGYAISIYFIIFASKLLITLLDKAVWKSSKIY